MCKINKKEQLYEYDKLDISKLTHIETKAQAGETRLYIFAGITAYREPKNVYDKFVQGITDYINYLSSLLSNLACVVYQTEYHQIVFCRDFGEPFGTYSLTIPILRLSYQARLQMGRTSF